MFLPACLLWEPILQMTHKHQCSTVRIPHRWRVCRLGPSHPFLQNSGISVEFLLPFSSPPCAHQRHHHCLRAEHPCFSPVHTSHNPTALLSSEGLAEQDTEGEMARSFWPQATPDSTCVLSFCPLQLTTWVLNTKDALFDTT